MKRYAPIAALALVLGVAVAGYVAHARWQGRDVVGSPTVEFVPSPLPPTPPAGGVVPPRANAWPTYGYDNRRTRFYPGSRLGPPFRRLWTFHGQALLEFPPAVAAGRVFLPTFDGRFYALDARTGKVLWRHATGRCGWASPAVSGPLVYVTFIGRTRSCNEDTPGTDGEVIAFAAATGAVVWHRTIGPTESSPLVAQGLVYVGDWNGVIRALDARTGATVWRHQTSGSIKGSAAVAGDRLFIGDYAGYVYAVNARTGASIWRASAQSRLGGRGRFYSTPAIAHGRVYIGSTDGKVYSFGARSGVLRWSHSTGRYVYASPAVWNGLVLIGSYDNRFYALDAASGAEHWRFRADGPISGSATVVAGTVYFSTFAESTFGLDVRTGRQVWTWPDGKYSPVVTDSARLYLVGLGRLYALTSARR